MENFVSILGNALTGLFALLAAYYAWRLKRVEDEASRRAALAVDRLRELSDLYADVFSSIEQAMKCTIAQEPFDLTEQRSRTNAKVRLLGSQAVNEAYDEASDRLETWSQLHHAASPKKTRIGDQTFITLQAPDPTAKYKAPAEEAHKALHDSLQVLRQRMREDLGAA